MYNAIITLGNEMYVTSAPENVRSGRVQLADVILDNGATLNARTARLSRSQRMLSRVSIETPSARFVNNDGIYPMFVAE